MRLIFIHAIVNIKYAISAISIKLIIMKESALIVISTTKFRESRNINKLDLQKTKHKCNNNYKKIINYICEMRTRYYIIKMLKIKQNLQIINKAIKIIRIALQPYIHKTHNQNRPKNVLFMREIMTINALIRSKRISMRIIHKYI
jgi:hypothetical protein